MTANEQAEATVTYVFEDVCVEPAAARVTKAGRPLTLEPKAFDVLVHLLQNRGRMVEKRELLDVVWRDTFVTENNLAHAVSQLRRALGDSVKSSRYIETVPTRGYRFVATVEEAAAVARPGGGTASALPAAAVEEKDPAPVTRIPKRPSLRRSAWLLVLLPVGAMVLLGVLSLAGRLWLPGWAPPWHPLRGSSAGGLGDLADIRRLAVLPLRNLSGDPAQDYFADGMTAALITEVAKLSTLSVISHTSASQYRTAERPLSEIARDLGVDAVIEGSVFRERDRVRINVDLVHTRTGRHLWADSYERPLQDVLRLQAEIARAVILQVAARAASADAIGSQRPTQVIPRAYELYLHGQFHRQQRNSAALERALEYFAQALALDPVFAPAYAGLAVARFEFDVVSGQHSASRSEVRHAAMRASALDPNLGEAQAAMGMVLGHYDWDWIGAEAAFKRAIQLDPSVVVAYSEYAFLLQAQARFEEALVQVGRAVALDPRSPLSLSDEGRTFYRARRYVEAEDRYQRALALQPGFEFGIDRLLKLYLVQRRFSEVRQILDQMEQVPPYRAPRVARALLEAASGNAIVARRLIAPFLAAPIARRRLAAEVFALIGDHDRAFEILDAAVATRSIFPFTWVDPTLDPLRADPRFARLVEKMGLPVDRIVALGH